MVELLDLTKRSTLDHIPQIIEEFIDYFSEELVPFAVELCASLIQMADEFSGDLGSAPGGPTGIPVGAGLEWMMGMDDEGENIGLTIGGLIKDVTGVILACMEHPEVTKMLEPIVLPFVAKHIQAMNIGTFDLFALLLFDVAPFRVFYCRRRRETRFSLTLHFFFFFKFRTSTKYRTIRRGFGSCGRAHLCPQRNFSRIMAALPSDLSRFQERSD
jgi:hypothetical protein